MSSGSDLLQLLRALTPGSLYARSSVSHLQAASLAFGDGDIKKFSWDLKGMLHAVYEDENRYQITIKAVGDEVVSSCGCHWKSKNIACFHELSALMSICYILRGSTFGQKPPKNWLTPRSKELLAIPGDFTPTLPALLIPAETNLYSGKFKPQYFATNLGASAEVHQAPPNLRKLLLKEWPNLNPEHFSEWLLSAEAQKLPVFCFDFKKENLLREKTILSLQSQTWLKHEKKTIELAQAIDSENSALLFSELEPISIPYFFHPKTGELVYLDTKGLEFWKECRNRYEIRDLIQKSTLNEIGRSDASFDLFELSIPLEVWNRIAIKYRTLGEAQLFPGTRLFPEGAIPTVLPKWTLNSEPCLKEDEMRTITLTCEAGGVELPYFQEILTSLASTFQNLAGSSRKKWGGLWKHIAEWYQCMTAEARDGVVAGIIQELSASGLQQKKIIDWFRIQDLGLNQLSGNRLHAATDGTWFLLENPIQMVQRILAILFQIPSILVPDSCRQIYVPESRLHQALARLSNVCEELGVEIQYDGEALKWEPLALQIHADQLDDELDWFELRPEVSCQGKLIPLEEWQLIAKQGYWKSDDHTFHFIDADSFTHLQRFKTILDTYDAGESEDSSNYKASRLAMFDWLELRRMGVACNFPKCVESIFQSLQQFEQIPILPAPACLNANLRHYQIEGFSWLVFLYHHQFGACLADDMGLGKTLQTIALLAYLAENPGAHPIRKPHLVVLPPTLAFNWMHEMERFCPSLRVLQLDPKMDTVPACDVLLASYEMVRRKIEMLETTSFHILIFDEAQSIKNLTGERSAAARRLKGEFKICLTGTPLENHAGEYYSIMDLALPGLFGTHHAFKKALNGGNVAILDRAKPFVLRRKKETILLELPPKTESDLILDLTDDQKAFYTRAVADVRKEVAEAYGEKNTAQAGIMALAALTRLRQICVSPALIDSNYCEVSPKIEALLETLAEIQEEGHAALIFSQFTRALDLIGNALEEAGISMLRMDGKTPMKSRAGLVKSFQDPTGPTAFLISLKTGGAGLNLTRADYVFHVDPWWNPAVEAQASDRAHRMGQQRPVLIQRLLMRGTVEEKITLLKARKRRIFEQIVEGAATKAASTLTREDFEELLGPADVMDA